MSSDESDEPMPIDEAFARLYLDFRELQIKNLALNATFLRYICMLPHVDREDLKTTYEKYVTYLDGKLHERHQKEMEEETPWGARLREDVVFDEDMRNLFEAWGGVDDEEADDN